MTRDILNSISSRGLIKARAEELVHYSNKDVIVNYKPTSEGNVFLKKRTNGSSISSLYFRSKNENHDRLIFDPLTIDSTYFIDYYQPSWDDSKVVIGIASDATEFTNLYVYDLLNQKMLNGKISNGFPTALGGVEWLPDNSGFLYTYIPEIDPNSGNYLKHSVIKCYDIIDDTIDVQGNVVFSAEQYPQIPIKETEFPIAYIHSPENDHFTISIATSNRYRNIYSAQIHEIRGSDSLKLKKIIDKEDKNHSHFINSNYLTYLNKNGVKTELIKSNLFDDTIREVLLPNVKSPMSIDQYVVLKDYVVVIIKENGIRSKILTIDMNGSIEELEFPLTAGNLDLINRGPNSNDLWVKASGWSFDEMTYSFNWETRKFEFLSAFRENTIDFASNTVVEEIEIYSHDSILVPLSIVRPKNINFNGQNRVLLYAYGAYGISTEPNLSYKIQAWVESGGIYACAHVRGGGEKGAGWYEAGLKKTKQNTWLDLIASAEYLIGQKYTKSDLLCLDGVSAGGICIGRAIEERPDLFKAAIMRSAILNPYRNGELGTRQGEINEHGDFNDSTENKYLYNSDSYENLEKGIHYPAVLCKVGLKDVRVPPWNSLKFIKKLSEYSTNPTPAFLLSYPKTGHYLLSLNKSDFVQEIVDDFSFIYWQTGHPDYQPSKD